MYMISPYYFNNRLHHKVFHYSSLVGMSNWRYPSFYIYTWAVIVAVCGAQSPQFNQATDLAVGSNGQVYVSGTVNGGSVVYRLNSRLAQQESVTLPSGVSIVRLALSPDESRLVVCARINNP